MNHNRIAAIIAGGLLASSITITPANADAFDDIFGRTSGHSAAPFWGHKAQSKHQDLPSFWNLRVRHTKKAKSSDFSWWSGTNAIQIQDRHTASDLGR